MKKKKIKKIHSSRQDKLRGKDGSRRDDEIYVENENFTILVEDGSKMCRKWVDMGNRWKMDEILMFNFLYFVKYSRRRSGTFRDPKYAHLS